MTQFIFTNILLFVFLLFPGFFFLFFLNTFFHPLYDLQIPKPSLALTLLTHPPKIITPILNLTKKKKKHFNKLAHLSLLL